jgi:hypothetical protein
MDATGPLDLPRIRIIVAVWGARYIQRFERYALASMLAPGNLPALARAADVELLVLTARRDIQHFAKLPLVAQAGLHARVTFAAIDDLIVPGSYAVTLTLAFTRGVASAGAAMTSTAFIFWNADFVMSDGTLARVLASIRAGRRVVCAGSFRMDADIGERFLDARIGDRPGPLALPARDLVALAMRHPHPTLLAMDMLREDIASRVPAQLFWGDYAAGVAVGRFRQIFMLCLCPTREIARINSYCDYSFVPELCPGEPMEVIGSSDEAFLLEMQDFTAEDALLEFRDEPDRKRPSPPVEVARRVGVWSTPEHRVAAETPVVFRAKDDAAVEQRLLVAAAADHAAVEAALPPPVSHAGHHYWVSGVTHWLDNRRRTALAAERPEPPVPPELDLTLTPADLANPSALRALAEAERDVPLPRRIIRRLLGTVMAPSPIHPGHVFLRPLLRAVAEEIDAAARDPAARLLLVCNADRALSRLLAPLGDRAAWLDAMHLRWWEVRGEPRFTHLVLFLEFDKSADPLAAFERLAGALAPGARVTVLLHQKPTRQANLGDAAWERLARLAVLRLGQCAGVAAGVAMTRVAGARSAAYANGLHALAGALLRNAAPAAIFRSGVIGAAVLAEQPWRTRGKGPMRGVVARLRWQGDAARAAPPAPAASEAMRAPAAPASA